MRVSSIGNYRIRNRFVPAVLFLGCAEGVVVGAVPAKLSPAVRLGKHPCCWDPFGRALCIAAFEWLSPSSGGASSPASGLENGQVPNGSGDVIVGQVDAVVSCNWGGFRFCRHVEFWFLRCCGFCLFADFWNTSLSG